MCCQVAEQLKRVTEPVNAMCVVRANGSMKHDASDEESEEDNVEGDYTVYECPGLAPVSSQLQFSSLLPRFIQIMDRLVGLVVNLLDAMHHFCGFADPPRCATRVALHMSRYEHCKCK